MLKTPPPQPLSGSSHSLGSFVPCKGIRIGDHVELRGRSDTAIFGVVTKVFAEHGHNMLSVNVFTPVAEDSRELFATNYNCEYNANACVKKCAILSKHLYYSDFIPDGFSHEDLYYTKKSYSVETKILSTLPSDYSPFTPKKKKVRRNILAIDETNRDAALIPKETRMFVSLGEGVTARKSCRLSQIEEKNVFPDKYSAPNSPNSSASTISMCSAPEPTPQKQKIRFPVILEELGPRISKTPNRFSKTMDPQSPTKCKARGRKRLREQEPVIFELTPPKKIVAPKPKKVKTKELFCDIGCPTWRILDSNESDDENESYESDLPDDYYEKLHDKKNRALKERFKKVKH